MNTMFDKRFVLGLLLSGLLFFTSGVMGESKLETVVVTTSMLESAVQDAARDADQFRVVRLIPPGNCPGHFDLKPRMLEKIKTAGLFICHDFQKGIESKVSGLDTDARLMVVATKGSYLVPSNYWNTVESVGVALEKDMGNVELTNEKERARRQKENEKMLREVAKEKGWEESPILAAAMQADFCGWLGFDVVEVIPRPDSITPQKVSELLKQDVDMVVGNRQTGVYAARMLAERMRVPVAIISNFPKPEEDTRNAYEQLLKANVEELVEAWESR